MQQSFKSALFTPVGKLNDITVKPVDKNTWKDFHALFEAKGGPSYCWCMVWRMTKENTSEKREGYIKKRVWTGIPIGLLAYKEEKAIAWCSIAPRETHLRLGGDEGLEDVWSLTCFFNQRQYRKQGLASFLIKEAQKYAKKNGARYLEAYPVDPSSHSYRFMGFVKTFEDCGFRYIKMAGTKRHVMVCAL